MHYASKELCQELHKLSGWELPYPHPAHDADGLAPAYTLGYLLRKLPSNRYSNVSVTPDGFHAVTMSDEGIEYGANADTPENAAAKLCCELFRQNILKREDGAST